MTKIKHICTPPNSAQDFSDAKNHVLLWLKQSGAKQCAIWGAGKNGWLAVAVLQLCKIEIVAIYDDTFRGSIGSIEVKSPPLTIPNLPVIVAIDIHNTAIPKIIKQLEAQRIEHIIFSENRNIAPTQSGFHRDHRIAKFYNKHEGETGVILCNGPSLRNVDLNLIRQVPTIGLNKIYLLFKNTDFRPDYVVSYIGDVIRQSTEHYMNLDMPLFLSQEAIPHIPPGTKENVYYMGNHKRFTFSLNPEMEICCGFTVTYVALQMAFYMGFKRIILVGADHDFGYEGEPDQWHVIDKPRAMHFDPNYFDTGEKWQSPNLRMIEAHYALARDVYWHMGREIIDATEGGKLTVFPKTSLESLLENRGGASRE